MSKRFGKPMVQISGAVVLVVAILTLIYTLRTVFGLRKRLERTLDLPGTNHTKKSPTLPNKR